MKYNCPSCGGSGRKFEDVERDEPCPVCGGTCEVAATPGTINAGHHLVVVTVEGGSVIGVHSDAPIQAIINDVDPDATCGEIPVDPIRQMEDDVFEKCLSVCGEIKAAPDYRTQRNALWDALSRIVESGGAKIPADQHEQAMTAILACQRADAGKGVAS